MGEGHVPGTPVWSHGGIVCTGESYKQVVKLTFFRGASLDDPHGLFNSSLEGKTRRAIDIREGETIDEAALKELVRAAVAANGEAGHGSTRGSGGFHELEVELELDDLADHRVRRAEREPEVLAAQLRRGPRTRRGAPPPKTSATPTNSTSSETGRVTSPTVSSPSSAQSRPTPAMSVERNVIVGRRSTSSSCALRTLASRIGAAGVDRRRGDRGVDRRVLRRRAHDELGVDVGEVCRAPWRGRGAARRSRPGRGPGRAPSVPGFSGTSVVVVVGGRGVESCVHGVLLVTSRGSGPSIALTDRDGRT